MDVKPGYKRTEVGVIPEDWAVGELCRFWKVTDCKHVTAAFVPSGYPVVSIGEVQSRFVRLARAKRTTEAFYRLLTEGGRKPQPDDLVLSRNATVGEVARVASWHPPFALGQDVCLLRRRSSAFSAAYLQSLFRSPLIGRQLADLMVGSTFQRVNVQQIKTLTVPMPGPIEQAAIADVLGDADALTESLERLLARKRQLKQAVMQELLTGKTRLPGYIEPWQHSRLGQIAEIRVGGTPSRRRPDYWGSGHPWLTIGDLTGKVTTDSEEEITELGAAQLQVIPAGTLLMSFKLSIGRLSIAGRALFTNEAICSLHRVKASVEYLYYALSATDIAAYGKQAVKGATLNRQSLSSIELRLPERREQEAISAILGDMDEELAAIGELASRAHATQKALGQQLLTGALRLPSHCISP